jgi:hypothetical protein
MPREPSNISVSTDSKRLRDRALWCQRLGIALSDSKLAAALTALAAEYEGEAVKLAKADAKLSHS